jgi:hypothetical protein
VLDLYQRGGVPGQRRGLSDDDGNRLADVPHLETGERRLRLVDASKGRPRNVERVRGNRRVANRLAAIGRVLGSGKRANHTFSRASSAQIDGHDPRVRVRCPDERGVRLVGQHVVVGIATVARQQPHILEPPKRPADERLAHLPARSEAVASESIVKCRGRLICSSTRLVERMTTP